MNDNYPPTLKWKLQTNTCVLKKYIYRLEKGKNAVLFEQRLANIIKLQITENPQQNIFLPVIAGCTDVKSILYLAIKTKQKIASIMSCHSEVIIVEKITEIQIVMTTP